MCIRDRVGDPLPIPHAFGPRFSCLQRSASVAPNVKSWLRPCLKQTPIVCITVHQMHKSWQLFPHLRISNRKWPVTLTNLGPRYNTRERFRWQADAILNSSARTARSARVNNLPKVLCDSKFITTIAGRRVQCLNHYITEPTVIKNKQKKHLNN